MDRDAVERGQMRALIVESLFGLSRPWHKLPFDPVPSGNLKRIRYAVQNTDQVKAPVCGRAFPLQSVSDTRQCAEAEASRSDKNVQLSQQTRCFGGGVVLRTRYGFRAAGLNAVCSRDARARRVILRSGRASGRARPRPDPVAKAGTALGMLRLMTTHAATNQGHSE